MAPLLLLAALASAAEPRLEVPQDPAALALLVRKAIRLGEDTTAPTEDRAALMEVADANVAGGPARPGGGPRGLKETGPDRYEGNMLGVVMETAMLPSLRQFETIASSAAARAGGARPSVAGLPAHQPAKALHGGAAGGARRTFYVLTDKAGPGAKPLRLAFRAARAAPGRMDASGRRLRQDWGRSSSCWYIAEPDGRLRGSLIAADDGSGALDLRRDPPECRAYCGELEAWLGSGCRAGAGWLDGEGPR